MQTVEKTVDLNAALEDISCRVEVNNGQPLGHVRFRNVNSGILRAVKLRGYGTNAFGERVPANGSSTFTVLLQDLNLSPGAQSPDFTFSLPSAEIRNLFLQEDQTVFADGSMHSHREELPHAYQLSLLSGVGQEGTVLQYLRTIESSAVCLYQPQEDGWICICGRWNTADAQHCARCRTPRSRLLTLSDLDEVAQFLTKRREQETERLRKTQEKAHRAQEEYRLREQERQKRTKRRTKIIAAAVCLLLILLAGALIFNQTLLSSRVVYDTAEKMARAVEGVWTPEDGGEDLTIGYGTVSDPELGDVQIGYIPSRGIFYIGDEKYIVRRAEDGIRLEKGDRLYEKTAVPQEEPDAAEDTQFEADVSSSAPIDTVTTGEKNALETALQYLNRLGGFSRQGLKKQLEFEGYTSGEIDYALLHCGANWREQAAISASQYLSTMPFSRQDLIEQLEYEGFTYDQAVYGVEQNGY